MIKLREHQELAIEQIKGSLRRGNKRIVLAAPCSMGKTMIAASIMIGAAAKGKRAVFFCDRIKLVQQTIDTFERLGADYSVMQGIDWRWDAKKYIQVVSTQTAIRRRRFDFDIAIVDECHSMHLKLIERLEQFNNIPVIGLSATPFAKGMGKFFQDLIVPITPRELIEKGWLCPTEYYVGRTVDTSGVKTKALPTGGSDYDPEELGRRMSEDETLSGDIVENYRLHSNNLTRRAVAFCPNIEYSKNLVQRFNDAGIPAVHIDGYTDEEERKVIYSAFESGEYVVMSCSKLLGVGWDDPGCEILIDCYKTKSAIAFIQRAGRIWRIAEGKEKATYLDHAGNVSHFGFPEDVVPYKLDDGEKRFNERDQIKKEEKEPILHICPTCTAMFTGRKCACGYTLPSDAKILKDDGSKLVLANGESEKAMKQRWYSELLDIAHAKEYSPGWVAHMYRDKFGVWPRNVRRVPERCKSSDVLAAFKAWSIRRSRRQPLRTSSVERNYGY